MCGSELFAMIVFLCGDLLRLKPAFIIPASASASNSTIADALRFFTMACKLPMELQMILCHRVVGSMKQNILHFESEAAFKSLRLENNKHRCPRCLPMPSDANLDSPHPVCFQKKIFR